VCETRLQPFITGRSIIVPPTGLCGSLTISFSKVSASGFTFLRLFRNFRIGACLDRVVPLAGIVSQTGFLPKRGTTGKSIRTELLRIVPSARIVSQTKILSETFAALYNHFILADGLFLVPFAQRIGVARLLAIVPRAA